jgi:hypothetical protein
LEALAESVSQRVGSKIGHALLSLARTVQCARIGTRTTKRANSRTHVRPQRNRVRLRTLRKHNKLWHVRRKAKSTAASKLAEALNFVAAASNDGIDRRRTRRTPALRLNGSSRANGTVSAGHPVEEELALCPHIARLVDALNRAGTTLALTERDNGQLLIAGDKLKATVPCIPGDQFPPIMPDPQCARSTIGSRKASRRSSRSRPRPATRVRNVDVAAREQHVRLQRSSDLRILARH